MTVRARRRVVGPAVLGLLLLGGLAACDDPPAERGERAGAADASESPGRTDPTSPACERAAEPGTTEVAVAPDRRFLLTVPESYDGTTPAPLLLDAHGFSGTAEAQAASSRLAELGAGRGYVVVHPQALGAPPRWTYGGTDGPVDDVEYVAAVLDAVREAVCVDARRVYATGISAGAGLAVRAACGLPRTFAAIAPVAGVNLEESCAEAAPLPVLAFHGTGDPIVDYRGVEQPDPPPAAVVFGIGDVDRTVAGWAERNGCDATPVTEPAGDSVEHVTYRGCRDGGAVELYRVLGGGHTWPGSTPNPVAAPLVGPTTSEIDASELMLDFFDAHIRPS